MMLFTGVYCYAHTVEGQDTSTRIAGNDNIRNDENHEERIHLIRGVQLGGKTLSMSHLLNGRTRAPGGPPPPTSGFSILNRDRPPTMVGSSQTTTQTTRKQVRMKEEPEVSPPKREPKCSFCGEETHSYNTCPVLRQMIVEQADELTRQ